MGNKKAPLHKCAGALLFFSAHHAGDENLQTDADEDDAAEDGGFAGELKGSVLLPHPALQARPGAALSCRLTRPLCSRAKPAALCQQLCHRQGGRFEAGDKSRSAPLSAPAGLQRLPGAVEPGGQIVGRHLQGAALLLQQGQGSPSSVSTWRPGVPYPPYCSPPPGHSGCLRGGLAARYPTTLLHAVVLIVYHVADVAGGRQAADVRLDLLAIDNFTILRHTVAVTDGSTAPPTPFLSGLPAIAVT